MQVGDKLVCINRHEDLVLGKIYTISEINITFAVYVRVIETTNPKYYWCQDVYFKPLIEFRKEKINNIKDKIYRNL